MIPTSATEITARWQALAPELRAALIREWVPRRVRASRRNRAHGRLYAPLRAEPRRVSGPASAKPATAVSGRFDHERSTT